MKTKWKSLLAVTLSVVMLLSGCGKPGENAETTAREGSNPVTAEPSSGEQSDAPVVLFGGEKNFVVVRGDNAGQDEMNIAVDLRSALAKASGANVGIASDWIKNGETPDASALEILVGNTNHPETAEVLATISSTEYAIRHVGNKIVIAAHSLELLKQAAEYFLNNMIDVEGTRLIMKGNYTKETGIADLFTPENPLSGYKIIYKAGDDAQSKAAAKLAKAILNVTGVTVNADDDSTAAGEKEIIIGLNARSESVKNITASLGSGYIIRVDAKKLVIGGCTSVITSYAVDAFCERFLTADCSNVLAIAGNYDFTGDRFNVTISGGEDPALAEGADLRIMSFNILAELWNDKTPIAGRDERLASILFCYAPDVIGMQEVTPAWYKAIDEQLMGVYEFSSRTIPNIGADYSTILYNTTTVELIEENVLVYSKGNDPKLRNLTYGFFRRKSDGATFVVTCTHWDISSNASMRVVQAAENAEMIADLQKMYNCPVFSTGDYNCAETSSEFKGFIEATGMQDPKYTAAVINNPCKTTHTYGKTGSTANATCIDHIAVTAEVDVRYYNTLVCQTTTATSDHYPIYIDVALKKK